jgi:hypothetical protein
VGLVNRKGVDVRHGGCHHGHQWHASAEGGARHALLRRAGDCIRIVGWSGLLSVASCLKRDAWPYQSRRRGVAVKAQQWQSRPV